MLKKQLLLGVALREGTVTATKNLMVRSTTNRTITISNYLLCSNHNRSNKIWRNVAVAGHSATVFLSDLAGFTSTASLLGLSAQEVAAAV